MSKVWPFKPQFFRLLVGRRKNNDDRSENVGLGFWYPFAYRAECSNDPKRFISAYTKTTAQENKSELFLVWMLTTGLHESSGSQPSQLKKSNNKLGVIYCIPM